MTTPSFEKADRVAQAAIERALTLAVEAEREECAKVAEALAGAIPPRGMRPDEAVEKACADIAAVIRSRGAL